MGNETASVNPECLWRIVIYGASAWLTGIAGMIATTPGLDVQYIDPRQLDSVTQAVTLSPDIVITERGLGGGALHLLIKSPVIEIDPARAVVTIRTTRDIPVTSVECLIQVIEDIVALPVPKFHAETPAEPAPA